MKASTLRHSILAVRDFKIQSVEVPEWGFTVHVRTRSLLESLAFEEARESSDLDKVTALFLTFTLCDSEGALVFVPGDSGSVDELCGKDPFVLSRIFNLAVALEDSPKDQAEKPLAAPSSEELSS